MKYKTELIFAALGLLILFSCNTSEKDVLIFKGHNIKCAIPKGWTLKQIDSTKDGGFSTLQQETSELFKPTICIWTNDYADAFSKPLGVKRMPFMVQMTITSAGDKTKTDNFLQGYEYNMGDILNQKQTTNYFFMDFKSNKTDAIVSMLAGDNNNKEIEKLGISIASTPATIEKNKSVADDLTKKIIKQLNN